jgi:nicotinate-nucleotide pyrophosphorylase (carboxylating)
VIELQAMSDIMNTCALQDEVLKNALKEDIGSGDITTCAVIPEGHTSRAVIIAEEPFVLAGLPFTERIFNLVDSRLIFKAVKNEGDSVRKGTVLARVRGSTRSILTGERTALNLLQRLSGIATGTREFVKLVKGLGVRISDTRKTTPGLRWFEKYAVRVGGGSNHRSGLYDGILIKDNHIAVSGSMRKAVKRVRRGAHHMLKIEVEAKSIREVKSALSAGVDIIMLDNMSVHVMEKAVELIRSRNPVITIEASGNIRLETVERVARTGVDLISAGALTHSSRAVNISMDVISPVPVR